MKTYRVENPTTGEVAETFDFASDADIKVAAETADKAFTTWRDTPIEDRAKIVTRVAELFEERKDRLAKIISLEMGKPLAEGVEEAEFCAAIFNYYADHGPKFAADEEIPVEMDGKAYIQRRPVGVLLGIMPWNFPYYQVARFAAPNLMLGNTILLKHAEICPRSALAIQDIMKEAGVPEGVYKNIFATHDQIADLIAHPAVRGVSLTGSERAGSAIAAIAGENLKKVVLELGGSDPYIILDTADVKQAAKDAWATRMYNTGQACNSNKRIIVMEDIYDEFVDELVRLAEAMKPGKPAEASETVFTPLSSRSAAENLKAQMDKAVEAGANLRTGGTLLDDSSSYFAPAVITDIPVGSEIYYEEFFGPVATVFKVSSDEEAVELANNSQYGLGGCVFSEDVARAGKVGQQLEVGMANVNTYAAEGAEVPFGGVKNSGYGRELGPYGMDEFVNKRMYFVAD